MRWLREQAAAEGARAQAQMRALAAALAQAQARSACGWPETSTNGAARARLAGCIFRLQTVPVMQQHQALAISPALSASVTGHSHALLLTNMCH